MEAGEVNWRPAGYAQQQRWGRLSGTLSMETMKGIYHDASNHLRRTMHKVSSVTPVVRGTASPFFAETSVGRRRTLEGLKSILDVRTHSGAGGRYNAWTQNTFRTPTQREKVERIARVIGFRQERAKEAMRRGLKPATRASTDRMLQAARGMIGEEFVGKRFSATQSTATRASAVTGTMKQMMAGTGSKMGLKAYQNAVLNPRNLILGGTLYAGVRVAQNLYQAGQNFRTEATGRGRFGTDTRGNLGPDSLKGMRFNTIRRKKLV